MPKKIKEIFDSWSTELPYMEKIRKAELILKIAGSLKYPTPEAERIIKEARDFLLQCE